jgi:hypothetical protein
VVQGDGKTVDRYSAANLPAIGTGKGAERL